MNKAESVNHAPHRRIPILAGLISLALPLLCPLFADAAETGNAVVAKLEHIVIPKIDFADVSIEEALDFLKMKCLELDPEADPARRGISFMIMRPINPAQTGRAVRMKITYSAKDVSFLKALGEVGKQARLDIHVTDVGIVICPTGVPPFPNGKAEKGKVLKSVCAAVLPKGER